MYLYPALKNKATMDNNNNTTIITASVRFQLQGICCSIVYISKNPTKMLYDRGLLGLLNTF
jgi:hypothetical protein